MSQLQSSPSLPGGVTGQPQAAGEATSSSKAFHEPSSEEPGENGLYFSHLLFSPSFCGQLGNLWSREQTVVSSKGPEVTLGWRKGLGALSAKPEDDIDHTDWDCLSSINQVLLSDKTSPRCSGLRFHLQNLSLRARGPLLHRSMWDPGSGGPALTLIHPQK